MLPIPALFIAFFCLIVGFDLHRHVEDLIRDSEPKQILKIKVKNVDPDIPFEGRCLSLGYYCTAFHMNPRKLKCVASRQHDGSVRSFTWASSSSGVKPMEPIGVRSPGDLFILPRYIGSQTALSIRLRPQPLQRARSDYHDIA